MLMMNCFCCMVERQKAFIFISNRDQLWEILIFPNLRHSASRIWTSGEPEFRVSWMKLCSSDKRCTTHSATVITTTPPTLCGETWVRVCYYVRHVCLYLLFCFVNLLVLPGTHSSSHEKKKWQSLHISFKPGCMNVGYFEWTCWYSSI